MLSKRLTTLRPFSSTNPYFKNSRRWLTGEIKHTCLKQFHEKYNAKMEPFAGYMMPIVYKYQTIKSEHVHTRQSASSFDVSHMMQTIIRGRDRIQFIESLTTADLEHMKVHKSTLSLFTNSDGGIIDDCIITKKDDSLYIVSNASNADIVCSWLNENRLEQQDIHIERMTGQGLVALQGPKAARVLQRFVKFDLSELEFMSSIDAELKDVGVCTVTRCGYTGEDGFEISVEAHRAGILMDALNNEEEVKPAGLGARDTLRLEAGLCLHGHDMTNNTTPVEAALTWVVHKRRRRDKNFPGSEIIVQQIERGCERKRSGLIATGGGPPAREGSKVFEVGTGEYLGTISSGTFAPTLNCNIAMAYLRNEFLRRNNTNVNCEVRGKQFMYHLTKMPFVKANYYNKIK